MPARFAITRVAVASPSRTRAEVTLVLAGPGAAAITGVTTHELTVGGAAVPLAGPGIAALVKSGCRVTLSVALERVPEQILAADPYAMPIGWQGRDADGAVIAAAAGIVNLANPDEVEIPARALSSRYSRVIESSVSPGLDGVDVRLLLSLDNPLSFDVVSTGLKYVVKVGGRELLDSRRGGFRLRAGRWSELLIEERVPLGDAAAALAAYASGGHIMVDGVLGIRAAGVERGIAMHLDAAR